MQILVLLYVISISLAHPHVFIDVECDIVVDDNNFKGFDITWKFDQMYSFDIISYMTDGNSEIDITEMAELESNFIETFGLTSYNTHVIIGENDFDQQEILNFDADITGDRRVIFKFHFPYYKSLKDGPFDFILAFYDETLYYAYTPTSTPELKGSDSVKMEINKKNDVSYDIKLKKK